MSVIQCKKQSVLQYTRIKITILLYIDVSVLLLAGINSHIFKF